MSLDWELIVKKEYQDFEILKFYRKDRAVGTTYRNLVDSFVRKILKHKHDSIKSISEYKQSGDYYVDLKKFRLSDISSDDYKIINEVIDFNDIMTRERLMRSNILDYNQSYELILFCSKFFIEFFNEKKIKIIIGQPVDNYVMDTMIRIAKYYGINYIGLVRFFYPGYVRITTYGEYNNIRKPSFVETSNILTKLLEKNETVFASPKKRVLINNIKYFFIYKAKYLIHWLGYAKILGRKEYDYISTKSQVYPKSIINIIRSIFFFTEKLKIDKSPSNVYIPLHYFPEATVEYWISDIKKATYYPYLYNLVQKLVDTGHNVLIKEHPAIYQRRNIELLKPLQKIKGVTILSPFISTYDVINVVDYVIVWTGTSGVEAYIHDKVVVSVDENYYNKDICVSLNDFIEGNYIKPTLNIKRKLVERILSNCIKL